MGWPRVARLSRCACFLGAADAWAHPPGLREPRTWARGPSHCVALGLGSGPDPWHPRGLNASLGARSAKWTSERGSEEPLGEGGGQGGRVPGPESESGNRGPRGQAAASVPGLPSTHWRALSCALAWLGSCRVCPCLGPVCPTQGDASALRGRSRNTPFFLKNSGLEVMNSAFVCGFR